MKQLLPLTKDTAPAWAQDLFGVSPTGGHVVVRSAFGETVFCGRAEVPENLHVDSMRFLNHAGKTGTLEKSRVIRVEGKINRDGILEVVEFESRPCGMGLYNRAADFYKQWKEWHIPITDRVMWNGATLGDTLTLYSPKRTMEGCCHSDDALFSQTVPWNCACGREMKDRPIIIRSMETERMPAALESVLDEDNLWENLLMPHYEPNKYPSLRPYGAKLLSKDAILPEGGDGLAARVKELLFAMCDEHGTDAVIVKPDNGTRSNKVVLYDRGRIENLNRNRSLIRDMKEGKNGAAGRYIAQPYITGLGEAETGVNHLVRLFYESFGDSGVYRLLGGFLVLSYDRIVHGTDGGTYFFLLKC